MDAGTCSTVTVADAVAEPAVAATLVSPVLAAATPCRPRSRALDRRHTAVLAPPGHGGGRHRRPVLVGDLRRQVHRLAQGRECHARGPHGDRTRDGRRLGRIYRACATAAIAADKEKRPEREVPGPMSTPRCTTCHRSACPKAWLRFVRRAPS